MTAAVGSAAAPPALALIVAVAENGVIGASGALPWRLPADLAHFRRTTWGHPLVMGRRTWESLGAPLPGRRNLVVTRRPDYDAGGAEVFGSLDAALEAARRTDGEPFVIGGATIFEQALPRATVIHWTEVHQRPDGDTRFPAFDRGAWHEAERLPAPGCTFIRLVRRAP